MDDIETPEEDPRIVTIGDLRIQRTRRHEKPRDACQHKHMEMDSDGQIVTCRDCGKQLTAWWALESLVAGYETARDRLRTERQQVVWERQKIIHLRAAKLVEDAWRRKMAPACPHCRVGILPEDGLGDACINQQIERQRRKGASRG